MLERLTGRAREEDVELCERCGKVCDATCRASAECDQRTAARTELLLHGRVA